MLEQRGAPQKLWDAQGMYPQHPCCECGKPLNADGGHPAELYAGTYTGLCYACERKGPSVVSVYEDGGKLVSHPPSCPSHSRYRDEYFWYEDCRVCRMGRVSVSRPLSQGGSYGCYCAACMRRRTAFVEEQKRRKLQGQTPFERLAARYESEGKRYEEEAHKRTTKSRTREQKELYGYLATDYDGFAERLLGAVWLDQEEQFSQYLLTWLAGLRTRVAAGTANLAYAAEQNEAQAAQLAAKPKPGERL
jgi:hypothetical protein